MKRILLLASLIFIAEFSYAQKIFSISTGPGADASSQMGISWAASTDAAKTYLLYTTECDKDWKRAVKVDPQQEDLWVAFDGQKSTDGKGNECIEHVKFIKCGVMLYNLKNNTGYKYVICENNGERSSEHHFKTAGANKWSCCIISDFHSYIQLPGRLEASMGMIEKVAERNPSISFVFSPGDVVSYGTCYSLWKRLFEEKNFEKYMWARVNGNHDNWGRETVKLKQYDISNSFFLGTSYFPHNGYEGEVGVCYHFRYGNTLFLMLNTEDLRKAADYEAAHNWVRKVVAEEKSSKFPPKFIVACMHYEWFLGTNGRTSQYGKWHDVFDEVGVDLAVAGNNHVYLRTEPIYGGKVSTDGKGTVYLQTSSSDNGRGREISKDTFNNSDLIKTRWTEGAHTVSAIHMVVDKNSISLTLVNREGKEIDSAKIVKN